jgi:hypothetical protein
MKLLTKRSELILLIIISISSYIICDEFKTVIKFETCEFDNLTNQKSLSLQNEPQPLEIYLTYSLANKVFAFTFEIENNYNKYKFLDQPPQQSQINHLNRDLPLIRIPLQMGKLENKYFDFHFHIWFKFYHKNIDNTFSEYIVKLKIDNKFYRKHKLELTTLEGELRLQLKQSKFDTAVKMQSLVKREEERLKKIENPEDFEAEQIKRFENQQKKADNLTQFLLNQKSLQQNRPRMTRNGALQNQGSVRLVKADNSQTRENPEQVSSVEIGQIEGEPIPTKVGSIQKKVVKKEEDSLCSLNAIYYEYVMNIVDYCKQHKDLSTVSTNLDEDMRNLDSEIEFLKGEVAILRNKRKTKN